MTDESKWDKHCMEQRVRDALAAVPAPDPPNHHFGRPYVSGYQIAITMDAADPGLKHQIGKGVGGTGTGAQDSLAQYIAWQLSIQIKAQGEDHYAEAVFLSNQHVHSIVLKSSDGGTFESSLVGSGYPMALFRLRWVGSEDR